MEEPACGVSVYLRGRNVLGQGPARIRPRKTAYTVFEGGEAAGPAPLTPRGVQADFLHKYASRLVKSLFDFYYFSTFLTKHNFVIIMPKINFQQILAFYEDEKG